MSVADRELIVLLMEEAAEVVHVCAKILRHGIDNSHPVTQESNSDVLMRELGDLSAASKLLEQAGMVNPNTVYYYQTQKLKAVGQYLHHNTILNENLIRENTHD